MRSTQKPIKTFRLTSEVKFSIKTVNSNSEEGAPTPRGRQPVADPGFSQGAPTPRGAPGYDFIKFSRKLHEIEKNLVAGGGGRARGPPPLDPPLPTYDIFLNLRQKCMKMKKFCSQGGVPYVPPYIRHKFRRIQF